VSEKENERPILIVKKIKKAAGHHGGAWKVAYADFVTAMMAFFMVMWLIASVNKETRAAIFVAAWTRANPHPPSPPSSSRRPPVR
jgi:chemotaxis protein MotB